VIKLLAHADGEAVESREERGVVDRCRHWPYAGSHLFADIERSISNGFQTLILYQSCWPSGLVGISSTSTIVISLLSLVMGLLSPLQENRSINLHKLSFVWLIHQAR